MDAAELIAESRAFIAWMAQRMLPLAPAHLERADLVQAAHIRLWQAAQAAPRDAQQRSAWRGHVVRAGMVDALRQARGRGARRLPDAPLQAEPAAPCWHSAGQLLRDAQRLAARGPGWLMGTLDGIEQPLVEEARRLGLSSAALSLRRRVLRRTLAPLAQP